jgi:tetratricopeptide (TPR) repeat protein
LLQIAQSFEESGQFESSLEYSSRAMELDPLSERAITYRLNVFGRLGQLETAQADYRRYAQRLKNDYGLEPSAGLHKHALDIIKGRVAPGQVATATERQKELVSHLLDVMIRSAPERLLPMFSGSEMNWTVMLHDREMQPILEQLLEATEGWSTDRRGVAKRLLALCFHMGDIDSIDRWSFDMHRGIPKDDHDQIAIRFYRSQVEIAHGNMEAAIRQLKIGMDLCRLHKDDYLQSVMQINHGITLSINGRYEEAEALLLANIDGLEASTTPNGRFSLSLGHMALLANCLYK